MSNFQQITTDLGQLRLAPPRFSAEVTELMELVEQVALPAEEREPGFKMSKLIKTIRKVLLQSAQDAGHTAEEADALVSRIELTEHALASTVSALGV